MCPCEKGMALYLNKPVSCIKLSSLDTKNLWKVNSRPAGQTHRRICTSVNNNRRMAGQTHRQTYGHRTKSDRKVNILKLIWNQLYESKIVKNMMWVTIFNWCEYDTKCIKLIFQQQLICIRHNCSDTPKNDNINF